MSSDQFVEEFQSRTLEETEKIETMLFYIEKNEDVQENCRSIKLILHSIKGTSGSMGFSMGTSICHAFEDSFAEIDFSNFTQENFDNCISLVDLMRSYFSRLLDQNEEFLNEIKQSLISISATYSETTGYRVLIAENSLTISASINKALADLGIMTSSVTDGYTALGRILNEDFDGILLSYNLDKINGAQLATFIPQMGKKFENLSINLMSSNKINTDKIPEKVNIFYKDKDLLNNLQENYKKELEQYLQVPEKVSEESIKGKILCIDDDDLMHHLFNMSFKKFDKIELVGKTSPIEAIDEILTIKPDIILLDYYMDEMNGPDVYFKLRDALGDEIPIIFLTGKTEEDEIASLKELGATGIINKPFKPKELAQQVFKLTSEKK